MKKFTFLIPVYNDWNNLSRLLKEIDQEIDQLNYGFDVIILNDFSSIKHDISIKNLKKIKKIKIINFEKNIGNQKAIAIGLRYISKMDDNNEKMIIVLDSDGQDDPGILNKIIEKNNNSPDQIITINRTTRPEALWFKILYEVHYYTLIFFSGRKIRYGNYSLINANKLNTLVNSGDLWLAYPAAISKCFKDIKKIFHKRKQRYSGTSKVNLYKLTIHALKVFSVFKYKVFISSLIYSMIFLFLGKNFHFFIYIILLANILIFGVSLNSKKKFEVNFESIIKNVETIN